MITTRYLLCIPLLLSVSVVCAVSMQEQFFRGNDAYHHGKFDDAMHAYAMVTNKGPGTWYNMGNTAWHQNDYAHALLYWYRAYPRAHKELHELLLRNRMLIYERAQTKRAVRYMVWYDTLSQYYTYFSTYTLQCIVMVLWVLIIMLFCMGRYRRFYVIKWLGLLCCVPLLCYGTVGLYMRYRLFRDPLAIVMKDAPMRTGPGDWYAPIGTIACADEVICLRKQNGWAKILTHDISGWVNNAVIEQINE